jgi:hypothetical protein
MCQKLLGSRPFLFPEEAGDSGAEQMLVESGGDSRMMGELSQIDRLPRRSRPSFSQ